jgi:glutamine synthetase type I
MEDLQVIKVQNEIKSMVEAVNQVKDIKNGSGLAEAVKSNKITHLRLLWTSINGCLQSQEVVTSHFDFAKEEDKYTIDGSSFPHWQGIENSDIYLELDYGTAFIDPLSSHVINIFTTVHTPDGKPYDKCPRGTLKKAAEVLASSSVKGKAYFGPEPEFYLVDKISFSSAPYDSGYKIHDTHARWNSDVLSAGTSRNNGAYMGAGVNDPHKRIRESIELVLNKAGVGITKGHTEVGGLQHELGLRVNPAIKAADNLQLYRMYVKKVASLFNKHATFIPKLIAGENGNGMHVHMSIVSDGENLFAETNNTLSPIAYFSMNGILKHANSLAAFTNSSVVSYKRLIPGFEAPTALVVSKKNRSAGIRIPAFYSKNGARFEVRWGDPISNPYFMLSGFILAMLDGIKEGISEVPEVDFDLFDENELKKNESIEHLTDSLDKALIFFSKDREFLTKSGVFSEALINSYLDSKQDELQFMKQVITHADIEYVEHYYSR